MKSRAAVVLSTLTIIGVASLIIPEPVVAGGPFNMMNPSRAMNPSRWFGNNRNYNDDYYDEGYYGAPGYGYGGPGYGYGAPGYGYGAPGYGAPGYGYAAPGYGAPVQPAPAAPPVPSGEDSSAKIKALEDRIKQLEAGQPQGLPAYDGRQYPATPQSSGPVPQSAPYPAPPVSGNYVPAPGSTFRPTN